MGLSTLSTLSYREGGVSMFLCSLKVFKGCISNESKRVKMENNTPDNKLRRTGYIVHVLPQEKLNIDDINDVFIHFNR